MPGGICCFIVSVGVSLLVIEKSGIIDFEKFYKLENHPTSNSKCNPKPKLVCSL